MGKYFAPLKLSIESAKPFRRRRWKRSSIELNGRFEPSYRHEMSGLLIHSYSEMHRRASEANISPQMLFRKQGISTIDFDNKGIYLVSVTKLGCLTVHDFEALYCQIHGSILILRRECCTFSNGEYVKSGLAELEKWCDETTEEYVATSWDELKHIRQAVGFLVINQKSEVSYNDLTNELCPVSLCFSDA